MLNSPVLPENSKSFLITSSTTGEGKSTIASYLAITASIYKTKKTLLVDADLRRPVQHKLFGLRQEGGLTEVIVNGAKLEDSFKRTQLDNLQLLTSGKQQVSPTEILDSLKMYEVIDAAKFYFDLIIVDCAPVIPVSDPLILGGGVDGLLMVIKAGATPRDVSKRACDLVRQSGANLIGIAMNNVKHYCETYC